MLCKYTETFNTTSDISKSYKLKRLLVRRWVAHKALRWNVFFGLMSMQCSLLWPFWVASFIKGRVKQACFNLYDPNQSQSLFMHFLSFGLYILLKTKSLKVAWPQKYGLSALESTWLVAGTFKPKVIKGVCIWNWNYWSVLRQCKWKLSCTFTVFKIHSLYF